MLKWIEIIYRSSTFGWEQQCTNHQRSNGNERGKTHFKILIFTLNHCIEIAMNVLWYLWIDLSLFMGVRFRILHIWIKNVSLNLFMQTSIFIYTVKHHEKKQKAFRKQLYRHEIQVQAFWNRLCACDVDCSILSIKMIKPASLLSQLINCLFKFHKPIALLLGWYSMKW